MPKVNEDKRPMYKLEGTGEHRCRFYTNAEFKVGERVPLSVLNVDGPSRIVYFEVTSVRPSGGDHWAEHRVEMVEQLDKAVG